MMVVKIVRIALITLSLLTLVAQFDVPVAQARKGSLLLRGLTSAYMQVNQPGSNCSQALTPNWSPPTDEPISAPAGGNTRRYTYGDGVFSTWDALTGEVGGRLKRLPGTIRHRGVLAQTENQPYTYIDPKTGRTLTIDDRGHATVTDAQGATDGEFDVFLNSFGEPVVNIQAEDGRVQRMSMDGYTAEISPEGDHCILCDMLETYDLALDEDGTWMFLDDDGYTIWLEEDEDGTIYTSDSDGLEGVYYEDGSFEVYDENGEVIESGELENLTLEERADELGIDPEDIDAFFEYAFAQSGFEEIPADEIVPSEFIDDMGDDESSDDSTDDQGADDAGDEESLDDAADDQSGDDTDNQDSADDTGSDEAPADDAEGD